MVTDIVFDPLLSLGVLAGLGALAGIILILALWRHLTGWPYRTLAVLVVLAALANPSFRQENRDDLSDIVLLVIDQTSSQKIGNRPEQIRAAIEGLENRIKAQNNVELKSVILSDAPDGSDEGTLLMAALAELGSDVAQSRIAGVFLLTDGQVHDMSIAPDMPAPVHVLLSGEDKDWDRRLLVTNAPAFAILGEPVTLKLKIEDQGAVPENVGRDTELLISVDGDGPQRFRVKVGQEMELPLQLAHGGQNVLQFTIPEALGELTARNNAAVVSINGVRDRLRVLLVSGEPHAGERTWRNLLKSDSSVDLVHFTILRPPGKQDGVPVSELSLIAFPTRELFLDKIQDFDLIIFDRYRRRGILPSLYLDNVARYVENGGAVLVAAGPAFAGVESLYRSPLARVLPGRPTAGVYEVGFSPRISKLGERHPVTEGLENFAPRPRDKDGTPGWGRWFRMIDLEPVNGHAVMTGPEERPLLLLDRVGRGRVALLASDQAWLWHRGYEGGGPQLEMLRRLAHWMMGEPELEEEALSAAARGRHVAVTRRSLEEGERTLSIEGPDGDIRELAFEEIKPGKYVAKFEGEENGLYRLRESDLEAVVALGPIAPKEFENTISTDAILRDYSASTKGAVFRLTEGVPDIRRVRQGRVAAGRGWMGITPREAYITVDIRLRPIAAPWLFLTLAGLLMILAWRREGR